MPDNLPLLTNRELETLYYFAKGYSDWQIVEALGNTKGTVKNCLATIRFKLAAFSQEPLNRRTNLAAFYNQHLANKPDSSKEKDDQHGLRKK